MKDSSRPDVAVMVKGLAWDVGLPLVAYYALHLLGLGDWVALLAASASAALRLAWDAARRRSLNLFATVMLLVFGLGLALSFIAGDPRFLLVKASFVTAAVGLTFLVTAIHGRRPLTLAAQQSWRPGHAEELAREYRDIPAVRRGHRMCSAVWGVGLITEAAVRVPLIYLLPISVMVGLSTALMVATFTTLTLWTTRYARRLERAHRRGAADDGQLHRAA
jgi:hypothetical protein